MKNHVDGGPADLKIKKKKKIYESPVLFPPTVSKSTAVTTRSVPIAVRSLIHLILRVWSASRQSTLSEGPR